MSGNPIESIKWPYREIVKNTIYGATTSKTGDHKLDMLTSWLVMSVAFQAIPLSIRRKTILRLNPAESEATKDTRNKANSFNHMLQEQQEQTHLSFYKNPVSIDTIKLEIHNLFHLLEQSGYDLLFLCDFYRARLAAFQEHKKDAIDLYRKSLSGFHDTAGRDQSFALHEALAYSVGVNHKTSERLYWDRLFALQILKPPNRSITVEERNEFRAMFKEIFPHL